ncbi:MAG: AbrB/MazE/SpoVT family DNA-binding domain-containing protein [Methanosarcinales archaeon]|nr:AbrB/MazE/SpoVT family DNA-binding domain-containing protein [Methanosarcinales archaeon]
METRKVQRTGKSTFIVSLPKSWATKNGIQAGSIIYIDQSDNGAIILTPDRSDRDLNLILDIGDKSGEPLIRDLIGCYVSGYRTVEVVSSRMSSVQKKDVHQIVQKLIGPEILEETGNKIIIHDLLSSDELQAERALRRIRTMVKSMIQDSINALVEGDREIAMDVLQRDDDVDRLNLLILKQFIEILRGGAIKQDSLDPITAFCYTQAASNLERVADHAYTIAQVAERWEVALPEAMAMELKRLEPILEGLIDKSISALIKQNSDEANEIISQTAEIRTLALQMANSTKGNDNQEMMVKLVVSSSIERILDYINNIGELSINLKQAHASKGK